MPQGNVRDIFVPGDPISIAARPLDKGMLLHIPPQKIPPGGMLDVNHGLVTQGGIKRRPVMSQKFTGTVSYPPVTALILLWKSDGTQQTLIVDTEFLYQVNTTTNAFDGKYWTYDTGTCSVSSTTVTGAGGTLWDTAASQIEVGDYIVIDANGSGDGPETRKITAIASDTSLTIASALTGTYGAGTDYEIRRAFLTADPYMVDYCLVDNSVLFADRNRFLYEWDGSSLGTYNSSYTYQPATVAFWKDRVYIGNIIDGGTYYRHRVRWSDTAADHDTFQTGSYYDIPYEEGAIVKLLPMSEMLMCYMEDKVYRGHIGQRYDLPVLFQEIETGGIGLLGNRAVVPYFDGHFFVGQNNIYYISNRGFEPIGTPVVKKTIETCENVWRIFAANDPQRDRVVFGFPETGSSMAKLWSYNTKSGAWSYQEVSATCISSLGILADEETWDDFSATTWNSETVSWDSYKSQQAAQKTFVLTFNTSNVYQYDDEGSQDYTGSFPALDFTTGDMDYDEPSKKKAWRRVSLKIEEPLTDELRFDVWVSGNRGSTWKQLTTTNMKLVIRAGEDEGHLDFRFKGDIARFRFKALAETDEYTINEIVWRVAGRGTDITREEA